MDRNKKIKEIRKDFNKYSKELARYFKHFYKIKDDDIDYFCYNSYQYDYLTQEEQEELENIVLNNAEFFKLVGKCKINIQLIQEYNVTEKFSKSELNDYAEMFNVLRDMEFTKQLKVNLMKKTMIDCEKGKTDNFEKDYENDNDFEV